MKNLKELNVVPIVYKGTKTDEVREIQYGINDVLFKYQTNPIFKDEAENIISILMESGANLRQDNSEASKSIKEQLRSHIRQLNGYLDTYSCTAEDIQKIINFNVANYIKDKKNDNLDDNRIIHYLKQYKRIQAHSEGYEVNATHINSMQKELLTMFVKRYS